MKNKKFLIAGLIALLIVGVVSVFAMGMYDKSGYGHWKMSKFSHKNFGDKGAWSEKLDIPSDATKAQIKEALKAHYGKTKAGYTIKIREKLGLPDDASEEEVQEALQKWKENFHKGSGFHKGSWCGKS